MRIVRLNGDDNFARLIRESRENSRAPILNRASVTNGHTEYNGNESILVNGSQKVTGWLIVTGTLKVVGTFLLEGITTITGALNVKGSWSITGNGGIAGTQNNTGDVTSAGIWTQTGAWFLNGIGKIVGNTTLDGDLSLSGTGKITFGAMVIDSLGSFSGRIRTAGTFLLEVAQARITGGLRVNGHTSLQTLTVDGAKLFRMKHPTVPDTWIQHGSTESPISGTEYKGEGVFDDAGECVVTLPDYFEDLNKRRNRAVQITPVGRPFPVGADRITDGAFTAYGEPGREFFYTASGERFGGDFEVEPLVEHP